MTKELWKPSAFVSAAIFMSDIYIYIYIYIKQKTIRKKHQIYISDMNMAVETNADGFHSSLAIE